MGSKIEKKTLTIVVPCFNEEDVLDHTITRLNEVRRDALGVWDTKLLFVDDGSVDQTFQILKDAADQDKSIGVIRFTRNFGHQAAISAGVDQTTDADWVAIIDADLQDPPEVIFEMLEAADLKYDVVYAVRASREGETFLKKATARFFYRLLRSIVDVEIPADTGDFRVMSARVVEHLKLLPEKNRYMRGLIPWLGFSSLPYRYDRNKRLAGTTKYTVKKMLGLASNGIMGFSAKPLALLVLIGCLFMVLGAVGLAFIAYSALVVGSLSPGIGSVILFVCIFSGFQIFALGLLGAYVAKIFDEVKGRLLYVIDERINAD